MEIRTTDMLIGDRWIPADTDTFEDRDPSTGAVHAELPTATQSQVDEAVGAARSALALWQGMPAAERGRMMFRIADAVETDQAYMSCLESADNGRPRRETAAQAAIVAKWFRYYGGMADKIEGSVVPVEGPYLNLVDRVPVGVCAAITPWNHPLLIATKKIAPALACGNTIVVKPSELAPLSVLEFARLAKDAGLPGGVLNVILGGPEAGKALVAHPDVDRVDVTGSTGTGIAVAEEAARTLKRVGLELGGKAANLVFADADAERTANGVVFAGYIAQGQSCVAGARVLVERCIADEFIRMMAARIRDIRVGDPQELTTQMGPVITPEAARRIARHVDEARAAGAEIVCGGDVPRGLNERLSPDGYYAPTLISTHDTSICAAREEIFGPVVTVIPFEDEDHAVEIANGLPFGLGAGVWTNDVTRAHRLAKRLRAGVVWINDYHRIDPASPWGGFGMSGYGRENGFDAVLEYTASKSVWVPTELRPMDWYDHAGLGARLN